MDAYPVVYQSFESVDKFNQFAIADNGIALQAELNLSRINNMLPAWGPEFRLDLLAIKGFKLDAGELPAMEKKKLCPHCGGTL